MVRKGEGGEKARKRSTRLTSRRVKSEKESKKEGKKKRSENDEEGEKKRDEEGEEIGGGGRERERGRSVSRWISL